MATIIRNQAILNYKYGTNNASAESNTTTASIRQYLTIHKSSLSKSYRIGDNITYMITLSNKGTSLNGISICDDLGTYQFNGNRVTPLTYLGPSQLFINGVFVSDITPEIKDNKIVFRISNITSCGNVQILYFAKVNENANENIGSLITNTATLEISCNCNCNEPLTDSYTLTAEEFSDVRIIKSVCPNPINCGETVTYTLNIYNYGNTAATDIVLTDQFDPVLTDIEIALNGNIVPNTEYNYIDGSLRFPSNTSEHNISLPPADFTQDPSSGKTIVDPSAITITISGRIQ